MIVIITIGVQKYYFILSKKKNILLKLDPSLYRVQIRQVPFY